MTLRIVAFPFVALVIALCAGCNPFAGAFDGDSTRGERGTTHWSISDGLCGGFGDSCSLDVPIAAGATVRLTIDSVGVGDPAVAIVRGSAEVVSVTVENPTADDRSAVAMMRTTGPGELVVAIGSDRGEDIDRATLDVRSVASLACGIVPAGGGLGWRMENVTFAPALAIPVTASSDTQVSCLARDADGEPLLSIGAIQWTVTEGADAVGIATHGVFAALGTTASGARIRARGTLGGTATLRASLGAVSTEITLTIE